MKKNRMLKLASALLVLCLITTCAISTTFAKYVSNGTGGDSATVAKWGVTVTVNGDDALLDDNASTDDIAGFKVSSKDLAAPGTYAKLANVIIDGTPQVAFKVSAEAILTLDNWTTTGSDEYCPLVFTVGTATYGLNGTGAENECASVSALITAVQDAVATAFEQEVLVGDTVDTNIEISWTWAFDNTANPYISDAKDTILGNAAADSDATNDPSIDFDLTVTVEQVD